MYSNCFLPRQGTDLATLQTIINERQNMFLGKLIALCPAPEPNEQRCLIVLQKTGNVAEPDVTLVILPAPDTSIPAGKTLVCIGFIYINNRQEFVAAYTG